jgi:hypothetical protein
LVTPGSWPPIGWPLVRPRTLPHSAQLGPPNGYHPIHNLLLTRKFPCKNIFEDTLLDINTNLRYFSEPTPLHLARETLWNAIQPTCLILGNSTINIRFFLRAKIQGKPSTSFQHVIYACWVHVLCYYMLNLKNTKFEGRRSWTRFWKSFGVSFVLMFFGLTIINNEGNQFRWF